MESIYKYGCNHCEKYGRDISHSIFRNWTVCDECVGMLKNNAANSRYPLLQEAIDEVFKESNTSAIKRCHGSDNEDEVQAKGSKQAIVEDQVNSAQINENIPTSEIENDIAME